MNRMTKEELFNKIEELRLFLNSQGFNFQYDLRENESFSNVIFDKLVSIHIYDSYKKGEERKLKLNLGCHYKAFSEFEIDVKNASLYDFINEKITDKDGKIKIKDNSTTSIKDFNSVNVMKSNKQIKPVINLINRWNAKLEEVKQASKELLEIRQARLNQIETYIQNIKLKLNMDIQINQESLNTLILRYNNPKNIICYFKKNNKDIHLIVEIDSVQGFSFQSDYNFKGDFEDINNIIRVLQESKGL